MSAQAKTVLTSTQNAPIKSNMRLTSVKFHPNIWREHFFNNSSTLKTIDANTQQEHEQVKEEVRGMLVDATMNPSKKLYMIDAIQRLGVDYHFETEIDNALEKIYVVGGDHVESDDLSTLALWFRLLRQQGFKAPTEIFNKFMDDKGKFKESLADDVHGMLSLYEAAHLSLPDEDILDDAISFTTSHLKLLLTSKAITPLLAEQIARALNRPLRKSLPRVEARHYISLFSRGDQFASSNERLLRFAKIDFNIIQALHLQELNGLIEWWKKLDFTTKVPYARDRLVEGLFWIMGMYFEPKYSLARTFLTKIIAMISVLDDTYDNYGELEELTLLTECIERWDIGVIDQLPEFMKPIYQALLDVYGEMEEKVAKKGDLYPIHYGKESMKRGMKSYLDEARWREESYIPSIEEYMKVALLSTQYPALIINSLVGMEEVATKEAFEWIYDDPKMLKASSTICRLMADIVAHEFERKRFHVVSAVECYMKQYGVSKEETVKVLRKEVADAWKDINQGFIKPTIFPKAILARILNAARVIDVIYKDSDGYTNPHVIKDYVVLLLVDPVEI